MLMRGRHVVLTMNVTGMQKMIAACSDSIVIFLRSSCQEAACDSSLLWDDHGANTIVSTPALSPDRVQ